MSATTLTPTDWRKAHEDSEAKLLAALQRNLELRVIINRADSLAEQKAPHAAIREMLAEAKRVK